MGPINAFEDEVYDLKAMVVIPFVHDSDKLRAAEGRAADCLSTGMVRDVPLPLLRVGNVDRE